MGVDHVFHAVGNDVTAGQAVEHTVMSHGNAIVDGYCVELCGIASQFFYFLLDNLSCFMQMGMSWNKLRERVDDGYDRFAKLFAFHSVGNP